MTNIEIYLHITGEIDVAGESDMDVIHHIFDHIAWMVT